ncbi:hypothetical protein [Demequina salsinemoris]|uniref:hypothetical protein n=1 Tax=Demequina salsinemoris TaxID=577470 RepID=UPI000783E677|nr:hypothetical protein [Demequina salsinemoris]
MLALACAGAVAGCAAPIDNGDLDASDSPVARYDWDPGSGGMEALMSGTLQLRDGCLYVAADEGDASSAALPVFSRALAAWDAASETLTYAGVRYKIGDWVEAGGGWIQPTASMTIPDACEADAWGDVVAVQDTSLEPAG